MPEITIVTPTFNRATLLVRLWKSLISQQVDFQWVIVDDGSHDNIKEVVDSFSDARIKLEQLPRNMGVNYARNVGVALSEGNYVIFLDSDDEVVPQALAPALEKMRVVDKNVGVACFACVMAETGMQTSILINNSVVGEKEIVCEGALRGGENVYIYKKQIFLDFSLPVDLKGCEHVFVYAISKKWKFFISDMPLRLVHRQSDNLSGASSLVARSSDIAKSFEIILLQHSEILKDAPNAKAALYQKSIYRYGVAGAKFKVLKLASKGLNTGSLSTRFKTLILIMLSMLPLAQFELWRVSRINRRLEGRTT